jgi:hypothetical protein
MTKLREYLVALDVRSTLHAWIAAASEDDALQKAGDLYGDDDSVFTAKGGSIESSVVLSSRVAQPVSQEFRIAFEQPAVHTIIVRAGDLITAIDEARQAFLDEPSFFPDEPPRGWTRQLGEWDIVEAEEVHP